MMEAVKLNLGDAAWLFVGNPGGKMSKGKVVHVFTPAGWAHEHYVIEIPTAVEPLLEVRDGFSVSDSAKRPIGFYRREAK